MTLLVDLHGDDAGGCCVPACHAFVLRWVQWGAQRKFLSPRGPGVACALLQLPESFDDYMELIGAKSRNMVRKAERAGYWYRPFVYNEHLAAIHEINVSMPVRSGGEMRAPYKQPPQPTGGTEAGCDVHHKVWLGGFREGRLRAYCALAVVNELAVIVSVLGHGDSLPHGVMNGLFAEAVRYGQSCRIKAINYLTLGGHEGLDRFKRSVGFRAERLVLV